MAVVDDEDYGWLSQWRWKLNSSGYAVRQTSRADGKRREVRMHRALLGLADDDPREGDHINRDRLDNRRTNLRAVPPAENRRNVSGNVASTSRHRGVHHESRSGRWIARVKHAGKHIYIGAFADEDAAGAAAERFRRERGLGL